MENILEEREKPDIDLDGMFEILEKEFDTDDPEVKKKYERHLRRAYPGIIEGMRDNFIEYNGKTGFRKTSLTANDLTSFAYEEGEDPLGNRRMSWGLKALYALSEAEDLGIVELSRFGKALKFDFSETELQELEDLGERMAFLSDRETEKDVIEYISASHQRNGEKIGKKELLDEFEERMGYEVFRTYLDNLVENMDSMESYNEFKDRV